MWISSMGDAIVSPRAVMIHLWDTPWSRRASISSNNIGNPEQRPISPFAYFAVVRSLRLECLAFATPPLPITRAIIARAFLCFWRVFGVPIWGNSTGVG